jgi:hypothetical protein
MYSGTSLTKYSGRVVGAHQKIDRVSRKHLSRLTPDKTVFPSSRKIVYFEGNKGPDAIKLKSPAKDEPWHYFDPFDDHDTLIRENIAEHYQRLIVELKADNQERIAFEAAWLSHAIVDGLTPAHHYPYEKRLTELRGGEGRESRTTYRAKLFAPGQNRREKLKNNWQIWGPRGLISAHMMFEFGVASIIAPLSFGESVPTQKEIMHAQQLGILELFKQTAREIAILDMYTNYIAKGWTPKLAHQVRHKLGPLIIKNVTLAWYLALVDAGIVDIHHEDHRRTFRRKTVTKS